MAIDASIPMIATVTINSIKVKPPDRLTFIWSLLSPHVVPGGLGIVRLRAHLDRVTTNRDSGVGSCLLRGSPAFTAGSGFPIGIASTALR